MRSVASAPQSPPSSSSTNASVNSTSEAGINNDPATCSFLHHPRPSNFKINPQRQIHKGVSQNIKVPTHTSCAGHLRATGPAACAIAPPARSAQDQHTLQSCNEMKFPHGLRILQF